MKVDIIPEEGFASIDVDSYYRVCNKAHVRNIACNTVTFS